LWIIVLRDFSSLADTSSEYTSRIPCDPEIGEG
jgi:hypothetical protein